MRETKTEATNFQNSNLIKGKYKKDINQTNVLGYKGQVALQFGYLTEALRRGTFKVLRPDDFKKVVSQCKE